MSGSNDCEPEHELVQHLDGLGLGHGQGVGIGGGADGYWQVVQYPLLTHHNSSLNVAPGTGLGWVALDAPLGLWPVTTKF